MTAQPAIRYSASQGGAVVNKGSYWRMPDGRYVVGYYWQGKQWKITRYNGEPIWHESIAVKCRSALQAREEQHKKGLCQFRIEEFTGNGWTDVLEYYEQWMQEVIEPKRRPATIKGYWSYYRTWIKPFFNQNPVRLHEIQLDTLTKLLNFITLSGKGKYNVMNALHSMMDYAWRSRRIPEMPPFPKKEDYNIVIPTIKWLSGERQMAVINAIPEIHRPIFLWLKYHYRRPSEACALMWEDYDAINGVFVIRRAVSARKIIKSTKTGVEHVTPCHPEYRSFINGNVGKVGSHIFTNPAARRSSKRYTGESLNRIWRKACRLMGESIDLYSGLKHSQCSQDINERGLTIYDVQALTDHARLESVRRYAKVSVARKLELMSRTTKKLPSLKIVGDND